MLLSECLIFVGNVHKAPLLRASPPSPLPLQMMVFGGSHTLKGRITEARFGGDHDPEFFVQGLREGDDSQWCSKAQIEHSHPELQRQMVEWLERLQVQGKIPSVQEQLRAIEESERDANSQNKRPLDDTAAASDPAVKRQATGGAADPTQEDEPGSDKDAYGLPWQPEINREDPLRCYMRFRPEAGLKPPALMAFPCNEPKDIGPEIATYMKHFSAQTAPMRHDQLTRCYTDLFRDWCSDLCTGHSVLLQGYGNKMPLLQAFTRLPCLQRANVLKVCVDGAHMHCSMRAVLTAICSHMHGDGQASKMHHTTPVRQLAYLREVFGGDPAGAAAARNVLRRCAQPAPDAHAPPAGRRAKTAAACAPSETATAARAPSGAGVRPSPTTQSSAQAVADAAGTPSDRQTSPEAPAPPRAEGVPAPQREPPLAVQGTPEADGTALPSPAERATGVPAGDHADEAGPSPRKRRPQRERHQPSRFGYAAEGGRPEPGAARRRAPHAAGGAAAPASRDDATPAPWGAAPAPGPPDAPGGIRQLLDLQRGLFEAEAGAAPARQRREQLDCIETQGSVNVTQAQNALVVLCIASMDHDTLQGPATQDMITALAALPRVWVLVTLDSPDGPLLLQRHHYGQYRFVCYATPTFLPFPTHCSAKIAAKTSLVDTGEADDDRFGSLAGIEAVLNGITDRSVKVLRLVVAHQEATHQPMRVQDLMKSALRAMLARDHTGLHHLLKECEDHRLVVREQDRKGEWYRVPRLQTLSIALANR